MSDKGFKVKNGLTIQGTTDTLITADNSGGILIGGVELSSYSAPTLGSTSIASGATVTEVAGLSLASPVIKYPVTSASVTDTIFYASTKYLVDFPESGNEEGIRYMTAAGDNRFAVGDVVSVTGMNIAAANVTNKTIVSVSGQEITVFVGAGNTIVRNTSAYNASGQTPTMTKAGVTTQNPGTSGQLLKSTGTGVEWLTLSSANLASIITDEVGTGNIQLSDLATSAQTDSYTLVLADKGKLVEVSNASANTLTVPTNASVAFPIGAQINILQTGAGQTTVAGAGVTINGTPGLKLRAQWSSATLIKRATDTWVLVGDLSA
jgi:hypothetical protein